MYSLIELGTKIKDLKTEKAKLLEERKVLHKDAEGKLLLLECEISILKNDVDLLNDLLK
jgi:hypothetical protein